MWFCVFFRSFFKDGSTGLNLIITLQGQVQAVSRWRKYVGQTDDGLRDEEREEDEDNIYTERARFRSCGKIRSVQWSLMHGTFTKRQLQNGPSLYLAFKPSLGNSVRTMCISLLFGLETSQISFR